MSPGVIAVSSADSGIGCVVMDGYNISTMWHVVAVAQNLAIECWKSFG